MTQKLPEPSEREDLMYVQDNRDEDVIRFLQSLRPGDEVIWSGRKTPATVTFVDPHGDYCPASMRNFEYKTTVQLKTKRGVYYTIVVLNNGRALRVYRNESGTYSNVGSGQGVPDEFFVVGREPRPSPTVVDRDVWTDLRLIDELHPWRYSRVVEPSDYAGDIVVEPWTPDADDEYMYPQIERKRYAIHPDEVIGCEALGGEPDDFFLNRQTSR